MNKKKKTSLIIGIVVAILIVVYLIAWAAGALKPAEDKAPDNTQEQTSQDEQFSFGWDSSKGTSEVNTSARVDEIANSAQNAVENMPEDMLDTAWNESIQFIKSHADNLFVDNDTMEQCMYYGYFLYRYIEENAVADNVSELTDATRAAYDLGYNAVKAIKYVYRGVDAVEDEVTQSAVAKVQENAGKFLSE